MSQSMLVFVLVLTRISAFLLVAPVFSWKVIPLRIKVAAAILLAVFFSVLRPAGLNLRGVSPLESALLIANEATYGLALGLILVVVFSVVKFGGHIMEQQMGLTMAQVIDPLTGEEAEPLGSLLEIIFVILFLSADGHHFLLLILSKSYEAFPVGTIPDISAMTNGVLQAGSVMFMAGLRLAAPILAAFLVLMVTFALLARLVPEMDIFFISLPIRLMIGLFMAAAFLPFVSGFVREWAEWMGQLLPL